MRHPTQAIIACTALLGACASVEWVKSGGEIADEPVLIQCSQQAGVRARSEQMSAAPAPGSPQSGREQTLFNQCMTELGYNYVPITPGTMR
jgi:hypothetical protein